MSTYSNRLQPALQNLLQRTVHFFHPEIIMHDDTCIGGRSENNIKCVVHDDLGRKNRTTYNCTSLALRVIFSVS